MVSCYAILREYGKEMTQRILDFILKSIVRGWFSVRPFEN